MRILITGGFGYLGSYLARELSSRLHSAVRIFAPAVPPAFEPWRGEFEIVQGDVTNETQTRGCCRDCDLVLHLAALDRGEARSQPGRALQVSGLGTRNVLTEAAGARVTRVVYFSTIHVYGKSRATIIGEDCPAQPLDDYAIAHLLGELYCEQFREALGLDVVRLRLANGYGAPVDRRVDCWSLVVHDLCRSAVERGEILVRSPGTQRRDFIPIVDIRKATELLVTAPPGRVRHSLFNVASGAQVSINDVAERVARVYRELRGKTVEIVHRPTSPPGETAGSPAIDIGRIRDLGFEPEPPAFMDGEIRRILEALA